MESNVDLNENSDIEILETDLGKIIVNKKSMIQKIKVPLLLTGASLVGVIIAEPMFVPFMYVGAIAGVADMVIEAIKK